MSSFVYFKFKSQKDPTRVTIDGPHTDVWNLKREIINSSRLGDGTDFDLKIYKENSDEEYTDDTEIIPKDSTVLARRLPASAPGKGRAARYVSGKPPSSAKPASATSKANAAAIMDSNMTEEERIQAMLKMTDAKWQAEKEEMSHDTRINFTGPKTKKINVPEGEPPHGYICYRCMKRGHWIQACPTNDDATYDGKPRVKKTTGIPRSMLQKVDQSEIENLDESQRQNVMVTAEGEYVLAQADKKTWQKFQDQKNANDQARKKVQSEDKELQELGLECPIDKRMFVDPVKTPCCEKTYCHECIENALLDNDLECPGCHTANVSLEALKSDDDMKNKIKEYENKRSEDSPASAAGTPKPEQSEKDSSTPSRDGSKSPKSTGSVAGRKRTASEATSTNLAVPAPAMKRQKSSDSSPATPQSQAEPKVSLTSPTNGNNSMNEMQALMQSMQQMPSMPNMSMGFPGMMPFMPNMMNPMMMGMPNMNMNMNMNGMPSMNGMANMPFNNMNMPGMPSMPNMGSMNGMNGMNGMNQMGGNLPNNMSNNNNNMNGKWNNHQNANNQQNQSNQGRGGFRNNNNNKKFNNFNKNNSPAPQQQPEGLSNVPKGPKAMSAGPPAGVPTGPAAGNKFSNQQRHQGKDEDNAYMRQPVNPQRAMNRDKGRRGMRNAEYKEL